MPTPLEILLDPISIGIIAIYVGLIVIETIFPGRKLSSVKGWKTRALISFIIYFFIATYLPMFWDKYLYKYQLMDFSDINSYLSVLIGVFVFELLIYIWHRTMHNSKWLWLGFHQMHHSAERIDAYGAYYFSPLDMIGFTMVGSLSLSLIVGLPPQSVTLFLFTTTFLAIFQHTNIKTPQWLGYIIQRPESHSVHHEKGVHAYNYSDLPIFDIIFGTFKNPKNFVIETGFYDGSSSRIIDMLQFKDVYKDINNNN